MAVARQNGSSHSAHHLRFGDFDYDIARRELRRKGIRTRLQPQPLAILLALLENPGAVISREDLRARVWSSGTFVEFEQGLNSAMRRLRDALCDSADEPEYIETVPGEGYRLICPVEVIASEVEDLTASKVSTRDSVPVESQAPAETEARRAGLPSKLLAYSAAAAMLFFVTLALLISGILSSRARAPLNPGNWILVTRFDNRTGESDLDNVLDYALQSDLIDSRFVHVASRGRIQDALQLMRKPPTTVIDQQIGREVCLRDGGIGAMVTGRIDKLDKSYLINVAILDPGSGEVLRSFQAPAKSHQEIIVALNRLSDQLRESMGEAVAEIGRSGQQLEKVTTPSLKALQLFSEASNASDEDAVQLLEQAIKLDPEFASAYLYLGFAQQVRQGYQVKAIEGFRRAFELADKTSERERLFIFQTWYGLQLNAGDLDQAIQYGELLTNLYPGFYSGISNQADLLLQAGRPDEAASMYDRVLQMRPNDFGAAQQIRFAFSGYSPDLFNGERPDLAQHFRAEAQQIAAHSQNPVKDFPIFEASKKWESGDAAGASEILSHVQPSDRMGEHTIALAYLSLGMLSKAENVAASAGAPEHIYALAAFLRNGVTGLRSYARQHPAPSPTYTGITAVLYARIGAFRAAPNTTLPLHQQHARAAAIAGENAMDAGEYATAITDLRVAIKAPLSYGQELFLANSLAVALEHRSDRDGAISVLEKTVGDSSDETIIDLLKPLILAHLARLYREAGDVAKAEALESRLKNMLALADPDYSLDAQLADSPASQIRGVLTSKR